MKFKSILLVNLTLFSIVSCSSANDTTDPKDPNKPDEITYTRETYENPMIFHKKDGSIYNVYCADPDVIRCDEDNYYYMYCTNTDVEAGDAGVMYDRGPIFRSQNLVDWTWCASVFMQHGDAGNWGTKDAGVWGPSVIKIGSTYNYYYSLSTLGDPNPGVGVATSSTPYGPWTHYGKVIDSEMTGVKNSIDPQVFFYQDKLYMIWGSFFGVGLIELTDDGLEPYYGTENLKEHVQFIIADNSEGKGMNVDINYEGSYLIQKDGKFIYTGSQGTCLSGTSSTYRVKAGISDSLTGPYLGSDGKDLADKEGSFGDLVVAPSDDVAGTGHHTIIEDFENRYWIIYHGYDINGAFPNYRIPFIDELLWDENGYPYIQNRKPSYHEKKLGPTIQTYKKEN